MLHTDAEKRHDARIGLRAFPRVEAAGHLGLGFHVSDITLCLVVNNDVRPDYSFSSFFTTGAIAFAMR